MSLETRGYQPAEVARPPINSDIKDLTDNWKNHLTHVYANPDTAALLTKLIKKAKKEYPEDRNWLDKMKETKDSLENTDDEDEVREILAEALGSSEDDVNDDEDEEERVNPDEEETTH